MAHGETTHLQPADRENHLYQYVTTESSVYCNVEPNYYLHWHFSAETK